MYLLMIIITSRSPAKYPRSYKLLLNYVTSPLHHRQLISRIIHIIRRAPPTFYLISSGKFGRCFQLYPIHILFDKYNLYLVTKFSLCLKKAFSVWLFSSKVFETKKKTKTVFYLQFFVWQSCFRTSFVQ